MTLTEFFAVFGVATIGAVVGVGIIELSIQYLRRKSRR